MPEDLLTITPSPALRGTITLPGDKSISHRAALLAAIAGGQSRIGNFLDAGVTRSLLEALTALGVLWSIDKRVLTVHGEGTAGLQEPIHALNCGNSATTMRLLAGAIAAAGIPAVLDGSAGLRRRPMDRIVDPLRQMGVPVESNGGRAPLVFSRRQDQFLTGGIFKLEVASAQVKTCLLLMCLAAREPISVIEPFPSRDHTENLLRMMGASFISRQLYDGRFETRIKPRKSMDALRPISITVPGDLSSAAFLIVAALITPGSDVRILEVGLNPTRTGLLDVLREMGAEIEVSETGLHGMELYGDLRIRYSPLKGTTVGGPAVVRMIDEFPAFAVAAAFAEGETVVRDAGELRLKESDRIRTLCEQLRSVGIAAEELPDGFRLPGSASPAGGEVDPHGDHRIAMALAVAGLGAEGPVRLRQAGIIEESYPDFTNDLRNLGALVDKA